MSGLGQERADALPMVTVIIPMRNERDWIERCLGSVLAQDYPAGKMEVLVADGLSNDGSTAMLEDLARRDARVRVISNPGLIVPTGLNLTIAAARGEIIARVDAHTVLEPDYLRTGVEMLARTGAANVGGPMVCRGGGPIATAIAAAMHSRFGIGAQFHFATQEAVCDTVYMGMWPRSVFERVGLFDTELVRNQDDELSYRIRKSGGTIIVSPKMRSLYQNRESWKALARQFYQYGLWKVRVLQKHPRQMSVRHFVPPAFQAGIALSLLLGMVWPVLALPGLLALATYAVFVLMVAARAATGWPQRVRMALALALIHHCWAAGFLVGLVRFADRWRQDESEPPRLAEADGAAAAGIGAAMTRR